jgi:hypothetical protein
MLNPGDEGLMPGTTKLMTLVLTIIDIEDDLGTGTPMCQDSGKPVDWLRFADTNHLRFGTNRMERHPQTGAQGGCDELPACQRLPMSIDVHLCNMGDCYPFNGLMGCD